MINTTRFSILFIAVVYRLTFYLQLRADGFFQLVPVDKKVLLDLSLDQIRGNLPSPLANSSLYFIQLEAILTSLGIGLNGLHLFQFLAGIMLVLTVLTLGQRILGTFPSLFAGAVLAVYGPLLFQEAQIVTAAWTALFLTAAILLPLAFASPPALVFLLSGLIFGLGIQSQANMAISALAFFIGLSTIASQRGKKALFLFPLGILLALAPVTLHNLRSGEFLPLSTVGGVNFFIGNGPGATGAFNIPEGYSLVNEADQFVVSSLIYPEKILGHKPGYSEASRFWISRTFRGILSRPARSLALMGKKTALLLHAWETPNNISYRFFRTQLARIPLPLDFGILVALAIPGFAPVFRRKTARPAIWALVGYAFSVVLFFVTDRYRLPLAPLFALVAGCGVQELWRMWYNGSRRLAGVWSAVTIVALVITHVPVWSSPGIEMAQGWTWIGKERSRIGDDAGALNAMEKALEYSPSYRDALVASASLRAKRQEWTEAVKLYRKALETDPADPLIPLLLARALRDSGDPPGALRVLFPGMKVHTGEAAYYEEAALALLEMEQPGKALELVREAEIRGLMTAGIAYAGGLAALKEADLDTARSWFMKAIAAESRHSDARRELERLDAASGSSNAQLPGGR